MHSASFPLIHWLIIPTAPGGQSYYYNAATKESTYVRPLPAFPAPPFPPGVVPAYAAPPSEKKSVKKEKAKVKTPIPGTAWLRVTTTAGNVFFTNTERKESVWTVPEEIKDAVATLEREEKEKEEATALQQHANAEEREKFTEAEAEGIRNDAEEENAKKRKEMEEPQPLDELVVTKKVRADEVESDEESEDDEPEEEWQKEAAAQLAAEAEEEERRRMEEEETRKREEEELKRKEREKGTPTISMPNRVDLSLTEAKALFKVGQYIHRAHASLELNLLIPHLQTLLREKDINPLLPWDKALPQFISDPRYVLLPSVTARRDAFDEYCHDRARELRQAKVAAQGAVLTEETDPKEEFDRLLHGEVKSTRTSWTDFRRTWKKDRRFWGWGRDDREREKRFREWLKQLGERECAIDREEYYGP